MSDVGGPAIGAGTLEDDDDEEEEEEEDRDSGLTELEELVYDE